MVPPSSPGERDSTVARWLIFGLSAAVIGAVVVLTTLTPRVPTDGSPSILSTTSAILNALAALALVVGFLFVRRRKIREHRACMLTAFGLSTVFLVTYVLHHAQVGSVPFRGEGWLRTVYFAILVPHIVLAAVILPMALLTLYRGLAQRVPAHRKIARLTLPLWLYVSLSGVAVYWMLYYAV